MIMNMIFMTNQVMLVMIMTDNDDHDQECPLLCC
jgi:hypothetical protein